MPNCVRLAHEYLELKFPEGGPGAIVGVFKDGSILDEYSIGLADLDENSKITSATSFHAASVSKQFTAYAVARLMSEGRLRLTNSIGRYLPDVGSLVSPITIGQLLNHTSGLSDQWVLLSVAGWGGACVEGTADIKTLLIRQKLLKHKPGEQFSYTNTGYTLLAELVRNIVGISLADYLSPILDRKSVVSGK